MSATAAGLCAGGDHASTLPAPGAKEEVGNPMHIIFCGFNGLYHAAFALPVVADETAFPEFTFGRGDTPLAAARDLMKNITEAEFNRLLADTTKRWEGSNERVPN